MCARSHSIALADVAKGDRAEQTFRIWLDASVLPHLYVEQSPFTVPVPLRGHIKRPDYLVGIPGVGMVAFDVKAKTIYSGALLFDLVEVRRLRTFARLFHVMVYFACLDPDGDLRAYWVRLDQLAEFKPRRVIARLCYAIPLESAQPVDMKLGFYEAFVASLANI